MRAESVDALARALSGPMSRRVLLSALMTLIGTSKRGAVRTAAAQETATGAQCVTDSDCAGEAICSHIEDDGQSWTYCCVAPSSSCSSDPECCLGLFCIDGVCQTGMPSPFDDPPPDLSSNVSSCTVIELFPGYPMYRGFVAGLHGPGEVGCLEQLINAFPWFSRETEDQLNAEVASRLGLAGSPKDWVWENWLAIEAERGLPLTCYLCAFQQIASGMPYQAAALDPNDIRLQVGSIGSIELLSHVAARNGLETWQLESVAKSDYELRATVWSAYPGQHLNAWDLQAAYDAYVQALVGPVAGMDPYWYPFQVALTQNGYAPTPANAATEDQYFVMVTAFEAQARTSNTRLSNSRRLRFSALAEEWAAARAQGSTIGLGDFLRPSLG